MGKNTGLFVFLQILLYFSSSEASLTPYRPCVIENRVGKQGGFLAFSTTQSTPPAVQVTYGHVTASSADWLPWQALPFPAKFSAPVSNVACDYTEKNATQIYVQLSDGQVYVATQDADAYLRFSAWKKVGQNFLPTDKNKSDLLDSVSIGQYKNDILVFTRTMSKNNSQLYFCKGNSTGFGMWKLLGGSKAVLGTDATVIKNPFSGKYEFFMITPAGTIQRTWQHNEESFAEWRSMDLAPKFDVTARPVAGVMGYSMFNGKLMVSGLGQDGNVHRCSQTTCDSVDNPWGYCTWGEWHQTGRSAPVNTKTPNNLAMSRNVHFGMEVFMVDDSTGQLWHAWQLERDADWHDWSKIPQDLPKEQFSSLPFMFVNGGGWWMAFAQSQSSEIVMVEPGRSLSAVPGNVSWGQNLTVSWNISQDEASSYDWVGIYPAGANDNQYVDYRYVQGGLNPGRDVVAAGSVKMASYLPYGTYDVRYLVNKKYVSVVQQEVTYYNQSQESKILQLYRGIFEGLGIMNKGIDKCVDEGATTVAKFELSFQAFEKWQIYDGLHLLGEALMDTAETLRLCSEMALVQKLEQFIKDIMECSKSDCTNFLIDIVDEIVIIFMDRYEIYGDIKGASNSFNLLEAYQQGGLCVGRMVKSCLTILDGESNKHAKWKPKINVI